MILIILALAVLILPLQWLFAILLAAAFHELCHYWAVRLCGGEIRRLRMDFSGAQMEVAGLTEGKELICALAGPIGGLGLLFLARWIPRTAICAGFQSLFNLLPVYPLDGGRALRCALELTVPTHANQICRWVRWVCLGGIVCVGVYGTLALKLGLLPLAVAAVILGKIACKLGHH